MKKTILMIFLLFLFGCVQEITSFEECEAAGNPVMESYPEQCRAGDKVFTRELSPEEQAELDQKIQRKQNKNVNEEDISEETQLPNPASVNCEKHGKLEMRQNKAGTYGVCIFEDGSECEEWAFFRGECKKGEKFCKDKCGDDICDEFVCQAAGCPCAENIDNCPEDCVIK